MITFDIPHDGVALGGRTVLSGFSATLEGGQLVGIVGPNGAGKSTLLKLLGGLLPHHGALVRLGDDALGNLSPTARARRIAWLSQSRELSWDLCVEDVVAMGRHAWGGGRFDSLGPDDRDIVVESMQKAGAAHLARRHVLALSGGEQARVHLARLFCVQADILLLDEPLAALDIAQQLSVMKALTVEAGCGRLVCIALHDLALARQWCSRVLVLKAGQLMADGTPSQALDDDMLRSVFAVETGPGGLFHPV